MSINKLMNELFLEDHDKNKYNVTNKIYHGSTIQNLKYIEPKLSRMYKNKGPVVFASRIINFAACFSLYWNDDMIKLKTTINTEISNIPTELNLEGISLYVLQSDIDFNKPCSVYEIENSGFEYLRYKNDLEIISANKCKVIKEYKFKTFTELTERYNIMIVDNT